MENHKVENNRAHVQEIELQDTNSLHCHADWLLDCDCTVVHKSVFKKRMCARAHTHRGKYNICSNYSYMISWQAFYHDFSKV